MIENNILVISDTHMPFEHRNYLDFCVGIHKRFMCTRVVHIGDLVDNHSISYHEHDPDGWSPLKEMEQTDKHLVYWFKAFPKLLMCRGNHDCMVDRKGKTVGLPTRAFKPYRDIWKLPKGWRDDFEWEIDGVRFLHGTGYGGKFSHVQAAQNSRQSTVVGHTHSTAGVDWAANSKAIMFGMNVGCGIDRKTYAFAYGRDFRRKPIVGCGVVMNKGKDAQFVPMEM